MPRIFFVIIFHSFALSIAAWGQASTPVPADSGAKAPAYEVVSIKQDKSGSGQSMWRSMPDGFRITNMPLHSLLMSAYGLILESQLVGEPNWVTSDPYDVQAKMDETTTEQWKSLSNKERWEKQKLMMQSLLADRCQLKVHRETLQLPVYDMVIAKGGAKMKEAAANESGFGTYKNDEIQAQATAVSSLLFSLSGNVGRLIVD